MNDIWRKIETKLYDARRKEYIEDISYSFLEGMKSPTYVHKELPSDLRKEYLDYYSSLGYENVPLDWIEYIWSIKGAFDVGYIPDILQHTYIDPIFPYRRYQLADKNLQQFFLQDLVSFPETIVKNVNGIFVDKDGKILNVREAMSLVSEYDECIIKPSIQTGGGLNVRLLHPDDEDITALMANEYKKDFIVQKRIEQDPYMASFNESSINTVRILTFYHRQGIHIVASMLRVGAPGAVVDNGCGRPENCRVQIGEDGTLADVGYNLYSEEMLSTPYGKCFAGCKLEKYQKMVEIAKVGHQRMLQHKFVAWDFAVNDKGEIVLIEYNFKQHPIIDYEVLNGPFYGDMLDDVLKDARKNIKSYESY